MNTEAKPGDKAVFLYPWNGYEHDMEKAALYLKVGETYTVERVVGHSWSTDVYFTEVPEQRFNSVLFADLDAMPSLAEYIERLAPSVEHCTEKPSRKAHTAALEWLAGQVKALEIRSGGGAVRL